MNVIYTIGCSASGKTTWAKEFCKETKAVNINRDDVRFGILKSEGTISDVAYLWQHWRFKRENEVNEIIDSLIDHAIAHQLDIVFSDTNLNPDRLTQHAKKMESLGYEIEFKYFPVPDIDVLIKRDKNRVPSVGESVIRKQWLSWLDLGEAVTGIKKYIPDTSKPKAIVCDIDGTVCRMVNRGPFEWTKVGNDSPRNEIISILTAMSETNAIVFLSGRDGCCRSETEEWLDAHFDKQYVLLMREPGDSRKDRIIKNELFFTHVAKHFDVQFVIDDRKQMTQYWQDIGMSLLNVGNSYEDF